MPLVKIDIIRDARSPAQVQDLADTIHSVLVSHFNAPKLDRYQIITQHGPTDMICLDTGLGYKRSNELVFIQVFQQGRSMYTKQGFYAELAKQLGEKYGLDGGDLIVTMSENRKDDWSFGHGRVQFLTGEL